MLGQRCVDGKSNEITAVPELLDQLALENSIVTLDAMGKAGERFHQAQPDGMAKRGCQTAIAERILARGGNYLLALKGNHKLAHAAVVEHFDQHCFAGMHSGGLTVTRSTTRTAAWFAAGCSPPPKRRAWTR